MLHETTERPLPKRYDPWERVMSVICRRKLLAVTSRPASCGYNFSANQICTACFKSITLDAVEGPGALRKSSRGHHVRSTARVSSTTYAPHPITLISSSLECPPRALRHPRSRSFTHVCLATTSTRANMTLVSTAVTMGRRPTGLVALALAATNALVSAHPLCYYGPNRAVSTTAKATFCPNEEPEGFCCEPDEEAALEETFNAAAVSAGCQDIYKEVSLRVEAGLWFNICSRQ